jgi:hypothetical protein
VFSALKKGKMKPIGREGNLREVEEKIELYCGCERNEGLKLISRYRF